MRRSCAASVLGLTAALLALGSAAAAQVTPFTEPPFADQCTVHQFGEGEAPALDALPADDPLCVEYQKRDITVSTGGAILFAAAEPARVVAALGTCQYWQQDHWSIQAAPGTPAAASWDGSYWFDTSVPAGGAELANFRIGGQPASGEALADALAAIDPGLADEFRSYLDEGGGGGIAFIPPRDSTCTASTTDPPTDGDAGAPDDTGDGEGEGALADTGASPWAAAFGIGGVVAALLARPRRRAGW